LSQTRIRAQIEAQKSALKTASALIEAKFANCIKTLITLPDSSHKSRAIDAHYYEMAALKKSPPKTIEKLLGMEGSTAQRYFAAWKAIPLKWNNLSRRPIPADWHSFNQRTSLLGKKGENVGASHPINAILNYAYAVLESNVRIETILDGFDPSIGYLHLEEERRSSFVFDLMEPLRPLVDRVVIDFVTSNTFEKVDFEIAKNGVCRLNPELARNLVRHIQTKISGEMIRPERSRGQPYALTKGLYEAISFRPRIS
jgi:CRISPR-associated endonuclease Cas1